MGPTPFRPKVAHSRLKDRLTDPFVQFAQGEANSGFLLMACAVIATLWATTSPSGSYEAFWNTKLSLGLANESVSFSLRKAVQDGLMVLFFLLMGLEIKREILMGELRSVKRATLPLICAVGGMAFPALFYKLWGGDPKGFGIPMATDIAFALGALAIMGSRVPPTLKIFLAAIAIVDDMGAILIIALFYGHGGQTWGFLGAATLLLVMLVMNKMSVRSLAAWGIVGIGLWACVLASGVHATVAGVILGFFVPARVRIDPASFREEVRDGLKEFDSSFPNDPNLITGRRQEAIHAIENAATSVQMPLERMENRVQPWALYFVMPVFALASAGIDLRTFAGFGPTGYAIMAGLGLGKPIGLMLCAYIGVKVLRAELPRGVTWRHVAGVGCLAGIGFTMALFIAELAFNRGPTYAQAQAAITMMSLIMGMIGVALLSSSRPRPAA